MNSPEERFKEYIGELIIKLIENGYETDDNQIALSPKNMYGNISSTIKIEKEVLSRMFDYSSGEATDLTAEEKYQIVKDVKEILRNISNKGQMIRKKDNKIYFNIGKVNREVSYEFLSAIEMIADKVSNGLMLIIKSNNVIENATNREIERLKVLEDSLVQSLNTVIKRIEDNCIKCKSKNPNNNRYMLSNGNENEELLLIEDLTIKIIKLGIKEQSVYINKTVEKAIKNMISMIKECKKDDNGNYIIKETKRFSLFKPKKRVVIEEELITSIIDTLDEYRKNIHRLNDSIWEERVQRLVNR